MTGDRSPPLTIVLDGTCCDPASLGGKGASLDRLIGWGLCVPATGVVTAEAYRAVVAQPGPARLLAELAAGHEHGAEEIDRAFRDTDPPAALRAALLSLGRVIGSGHRLAVRSSATVEDLTQSSFAGLYRSVLDVDPEDPDALVTAVLSVFASLWHPQARAYRDTFGIDDSDVAMAVVVMRMVPAERAGVAFTVDPGDESGRARVEAVDGLGESLVSGERTPDAWLLEPFTEHPDVPPEIGTALREAVRIETLAGSPQDVEWAWTDGSLWIVQARPITTAGPHDDGDGFDSPVGDTDLTTAGIGEMVPGVLPPLLWELNSHLVDEAFMALLDALGLPVEEAPTTGLLRRVRGRVALDFSALQRISSHLPGGAAEDLELQYFGSRRTGRSAARAEPTGNRLAAIRHDVRVLVQQHRATQDADVVCVAATEIRRRRPDLGALDDDALTRYRFRLVDLGVRAMAAELASAAGAATAYRRLELTLASHFDDAEATRLAGTITAHAGIVAVPSTGASAAVFAGPTWEETGRPAPTPPDDAVDPGAELGERLGAVSGLDADSPVGWFRRRRIERAAQEAVEQLRRREQTKTAVLEVGGEVRRVHRELGDRLVVRGALEDGDDVDLLTGNELCASLRGAGPALGLIARRRRARRRYEDEGPLPLRFEGRPQRRVGSLPPGDRLEGWASSAGRCTGRAAFLGRPSDALPDGAILLAEATDASWSPAFARAGAIVLERGGPLSHAAILARELSVPAVLNVGSGLRSLDGRLLTVDGDSGIVVVHDEPVDPTADAAASTREDR